MLNNLYIAHSKLTFISSQFVFFFLIPDNEEFEERDSMHFEETSFAVGSQYQIECKIRRFKVHKSIMKIILSLQFFQNCLKTRKRFLKTKMEHHNKLKKFKGTKN